MATPTASRPTTEQAVYVACALLNTEQAAAYIGCTKGTLEVWRCKNRFNIPHLRVGRLVKYRQSDLDAFLESRVVGGE